MSYNIGIYTRLSKEDEDKIKAESESILNQKSIIEQFIKCNYEFKDSKTFYYSDDGYVGSNFERPSFKKLIDDVKKGKINCIIVKDLSRFGRDYIKVGEYIDKIFPFLQIRFIAINDNYDSNSINLSLDVSFQNIINAYYSKDLSKKVKTGMISKVKTGCYIWTYAPFGYKKNEKTKNLEIDEETAPIVKMIFELLSKGYTYNKVCKFLNDKNIPTRSYFKIKNSKKNTQNIENNKIWKTQDLKNIKSNEVYIGNSVSFKRKRIKCGSDKTIKSNENEIIKIENTHQPMISKEIFEKVNSNKRKYKNIKVENIFAYKLKCSYCGYSLRYYKILKNGIIVDKKYFCNSKNEKENISCFKGEIYENDLKEIVLESLKKQIIIYLKEINKNIILNNDVKKYDSELNKYINKKISYYKDYLEDRIEKNEYISIKINIENKINELKNKINENKEKVVNEEISLEEILFKELSKKIVDIFIDSIYVYNESSIKINFKIKKFF